MSKAAFGVIGLGTMGRNLALNIESRGVTVAVWNREQDWTEAFVAEHPGKAGKREIARAFGIKGGDKIALKAIPLA